MADGKTSPHTDFPEVGFTAGTDEHDTPAEFFAPVAESIGGFDLDPCASETSDLADVNLTKEDDGLSYEWWGDVYMNPPYSEITEWASKAAVEYYDDNADRVVALAYARTSTQWFHNWATTADWWCFLEGRLTFSGADNSAPAPSLVMVWGELTDPLREALEYQPQRGKTGHIVKV